MSFSVEIINPDDPEGDKIKATFPDYLYQNYFKYHPVRYLNLICAKFVLENPIYIFEGTRDGSGDGWCFTGRPSSWYLTEELRVPFSEEFVYAVYLNTRFTVFECRSELSSSEDENLPVDWEERYSNLVWKSTF